MRQTWIGNLQTGKWREGPDMQVPRAFFASARVGDDIYAIGKTIEKLAKGTTAWAQVAAPAGIPESHFAAAAIGKRIYMLGGYPADSGKFQSFDTVTLNMRPEPPLPGFSPGDHFHIVVALDNKIHVIGGFDGNDFREKTAHHVFDGTKWSRARGPKHPMWAKFSVIQALGSRVFVFDDKHGAVYNASDDRWRDITPLPFSLSMPASYASAGKIVVVGGERDSPWRGVLVYDIAAERWIAR